MVRKGLFALGAMLILASSSFAVPNLQLYIPGGSYNSSSETWVTSASSFEVWVVAANLNHGDIYDINLVASLMSGEAPMNGGLTITPFGGSATTFDASDYAYGTPPIGDPLPSHGIFPTNYVQMLVANKTTDGPFVTVPDYTSSTGSNNYGQIFKFNVSTTYDYVHFDAYGYYNCPDGRRIFAPFSHDAERGTPPVPEPATMLLFGIGMAGAGIYRKFRK